MGYGDIAWIYAQSIHNSGYNIHGGARGEIGLWTVDREESSEAYSAAGKEAGRASPVAPFSPEGEGEKTKLDSADETAVITTLPGAPFKNGPDCMSRGHLPACSAPDILVLAVMTLPGGVFPADRWAHIVDPAECFSIPGSP